MFMFPDYDKEPTASAVGSVFLITNQNGVNFIKVEADIADKVFEKTTEFVSKSINK